MRRPSGPHIIAVLLALALSACGSISRTPLDPQLLADAPSASPLDAFRFSEVEEAAGLRFLEGWQAERRALDRPRIEVLAISSGGANGAYGAGVLVGWTRQGDRPVFDLVTGVSTGALIAPFAFLGSEWDAQLEAAYTDADAARLTHGAWGIFSGPSLFAGGSLRALVGKYVDAALLEAIAREHAAGRRLLVATTDLDRQSTILWDMGAIALAGQAPGQTQDALTLFETVLVASASIPGLFPPVMIDRDGLPGGVLEMHVDGGVTTPFVLAPADPEFWRAEPLIAPDRLFVIVNGELAPAPSITRGAAAPILTRAFDTMSKADARAHLTTSAAFAAVHGASLSYAAIPPELGADSLAFDVESMRRLFDAGVARGAAGTAFTAVGREERSAP
ncbi:MAG: patatin-like phospholipase family protein [Caulobacteraceae bacterium]|nr:patatin-like phospholipase family protein [Caulobacteraceae bacterium]